MGTERLISRSARPRPSTADEATRTVELTIATQADVGDGVILRCEPGSFDHGPVVPVLLGHQNSPDSMAGRISQLRAEGGQVVGTAEFTDAPAADAGWQLARSGCAVSVGASIYPNALQRYSDSADIATRWRLREASLVPVGRDPLAVTRSDSSIQTMDNNNTVANIATDDEPTVSRAELKRQRDLTRLAAETGLAPDAAQAWIERNVAVADATREAIRLVRQRTEGAAVIGHPATTPELIGGTLQRHLSEIEGANIGGDRILAAQIDRAMSGLPLAQPLSQSLKEAGYAGRSEEDILRNAFSGRRPESWLRRGFHATSDAAALFIESGDRRMQERFAEPTRGILQLARIRSLTDFREVSIIDAGLVGTAQQILEGGEIRYATINDSSAKYKPSRYGIGLAFSYESMRNDDLGGIGMVLDEASQTMIEREADALTALLTGDGGDGALAPDGLPVFHSDHGNSTSATMSTDGLSSLIELMRGQTSVGGRSLWLEPQALLFGPALESTAMQLMSDSWSPDVPEEANPWKRLQMIVEPSLTGNTFYLVAAGPRRPFELGRIAGMPRLQQQEDFDTSAMKVKIEHGFGCAVADHRVIVRAEGAG